jgi:cytochrome c oxidase subunit IV
MATTHEHTGEHSKPDTKIIWRTFWILLIITALEFVFALAVFPYVPSLDFVKAPLFIIMTLVKAFYIVGEFMHLKAEVKTLIFSIVLPTLFIVWLVIALLAEGHSVLEYKN